MAFDARYLARMALEHALGRGGRLAAVTIAGPREGIVALVRRELEDAGYGDVELSYEPEGGGFRIVSVEVDSGRGRRVASAPAPRQNPPTKG